MNQCKYSVKEKNNRRKSRQRRTTVGVKKASTLSQKKVGKQSVSYPIGSVKSGPYATKVDHKQRANTKFLGVMERLEKMDVKTQLSYIQTIEVKEGKRPVIDSSLSPIPEKDYCLNYYVSLPAGRKQMLKRALEKYIEQSLLSNINMDAGEKAYEKLVVHSYIQSG